MLSSLESQFAPVVLFVYNRPLHTQKTISSLLNNVLAESTDLIIYSDAAKADTQSSQVDAVREYIHKVEGFRSVRIVERCQNYGLAKSIIEGVTDVCNLHGRVIVLEDDLEISPHFLTYMNDALDKYAEIEQVMHISGCSYPIQEIEEFETYFLTVPLCWGWGTWKRAWDKFDSDVSVMSRFSNAMINSFDFENTYSYWAQLELNRAGKINTWFIFWYATIFLRGGLSLFPSKSLIQNIGFDMSGVNCDQTEVYNVELSENPIKLRDIDLKLSELGHLRHVEYFEKLKPSFLNKLLTRARRLGNRILFKSR